MTAADDSLEYFFHLFFFFFGENKIFHVNIHMEQAYLHQKIKAVKIKVSSAAI